MTCGMTRIPDKAFLARTWLAAAALVMALSAAACSGDDDNGPGNDSGTDGDTDGDTDSDTDSDGDTDGDTDSDGDTDTQDGGTDTGTECQDVGDCPESTTVCGEYGCDENLCVYTPAENDTPCEDDGNECTTNACKFGKCEAFQLTGVACSDDDNECTWDICYEGVCGKPLTGTACTLDDNPCTFESCSDGECEAEPVSDHVACDDGSWCDGTNECISGDCVAVDGSEPCATGNSCILPVCDEPDVGQIEGTCGTQILDQVSCNNSLYCDGPDTCYTGSCTSGPDPCNDLVVAECEVRSCDEDANECAPANAPDYTLCVDDSKCNGEEVCLDGDCTPGVAFCEDNNGCTTDICAENGGSPTCNYNIADDGEPCLSDDKCGGAGDNMCLGGHCMWSSNPPCDDGTSGPLDHDSNFCTFYGMCVTSEAAADCSLPYTIGTTIGAVKIGCAASGDVVKTVEFNTGRTDNEVETYTGCAGNYTGGEVVFEVAVPGGTSYHVDMDLVESTMKDDLRMLLITNPCNPDGTCLQASAPPLSATMPASGKVWLVIDGIDGNRGDGTITVECP
jgi:hypothetical protein